tara:strand:+ start:86 stop:307 length:222 start_codon:yes stop_codon:yes gene_type:complete
MEYRIVELLKEIKGLLVGQEKKDRWVDINQASEYCSVSPTTIRRNVERGHLNASKKLGKMLFKESDLEQWLNG